MLGKSYWDQDLIDTENFKFVKQIFTDLNQS